MVGQFLEAMLEQMILVKCIASLSNNQKNELFAGSLPNFNSKIEVGFALGVMTLDAYKDIKVIKEIRNQAAHRIKEFSFENDDIKQFCSRLKLAVPVAENELDKESKFADKWRTLGSESPRAKFTLSAFAIIRDLVALFGVNAKITALTTIIAGMWGKQITEAQFVEILKTSGMVSFLPADNGQP